MNILVFGNCQAEAVCHVLQRANPKLSFTYLGNSNRVHHFDPERAEELIDSCDLMIAQPIMKSDNPHSYEKISARTKGRAAFMPYIFVEGLHSLSSSGNRKVRVTGIVGEEIIADELKSSNFKTVADRFLKGEIDFQHRERLAQSLAEMRRREAFCHVSVSDFIEEHYRERPLFLSHNHPRPLVINKVASDLANHIGLNFEPVETSDYVDYARISLPQTDVIQSPYTVEELGMTFDYDIFWHTIGMRMLRLIVTAWREGRYENHVPVTIGKTIP